jgi:hypothetical protein
MLELRFDMSAFERKVREIDGAIDQLPYAIALTMNQAVTNARRVLVQNTWPSHVEQRNAAFIGRALRTKFASKHDLVVEIYDDLGRAHLKLHAGGGTKGARKRLAIPPTGAVTRTSHGVRKADTPRSIIARTPKRALRITPRGIFVGEGGRLRLKYAFKAMASQPKDVPFYDDFQMVMEAELRTSFASAMARAMKGRRA